MGTDHRNRQSGIRGLSKLRPGKADGKHRKADKDGPVARIGEARRDPESVLFGDADLNEAVREAPLVFG